MPESRDESNVAGGLRDATKILCSAVGTYAILKGAIDIETANSLDGGLQVILGTIAVIASNNAN